MIKLDINKGDYILVGRFKNKRIEVKEFGEDENGLPTINGRGILKIRIEKLMKPKKQIKESFAPWEEGVKNTKLFDVTNEVGAWSQTGKQFLQGCKHCNSIVKLDNMHKERQMIGNVYQSLCTCSKCKRPVVFDEHKYKLYEYYLKTILKETVKKQFKLADVVKNYMLKENRDQMLRYIHKHEDKIASMDDEILFDKYEDVISGILDQHAASWEDLDDNDLKDAFNIVRKFIQSNDID